MVCAEKLSTPEDKKLFLNILCLGGFRSVMYKTPDCHAASHKEVISLLLSSQVSGKPGQGLC